MKKLRYMVRSSLFAAACAVCAWLAIPVPPLMVTLQSFGILLALGTLGGKWGTLAVGLYLLLGLLGLPVFAGFRGGAGALLDPTGGFLWGFFLGALAYWVLERLGKLPAMAVTMAVCYLCGCTWFHHSAGQPGLLSSLMVCVLPYLPADCAKLWLALRLSRRLERQLPQLRA